MNRAILAGGCFWGMEELIRQLEGVLDTQTGYSGGSTPYPTYDTAKKSGHAEAIEIIFDEQKISYRQLLEFFFQIHDSTTKDRLGNDIGSTYRSAIFYLDEEQKQTALDVISQIDAAKILPAKIVTEVTKASEFYAAEAEHQDYLQHYPNGYSCHFVRTGWKI